jgi:hypothetical protein
MNAEKLIGFLAGNFLLYFSPDNSIPMGDSPPSNAQHTMALYHSCPE